MAITEAVAFCGKDGSTTARIIDKCWQRLLPWVLRTDEFMPVTVSFFGCVAFQHRYLVPLCTHASYIWPFCTVLAYTYVWFLRSKKVVSKELLLGEYHEDCIQLLLASLVSCYRPSCSPGYWKILSVPVLLAETKSLTL